MEHLETFTELSYQIDRLSMSEALKLLSDKFPGEVVFSTSFSYEDQVITYHIFSQQLPVKVFTLDTGRLFPETYSVWSSTLERYQQPIAVYYPDAKDIESFVTQNGPNAFYESTELRQSCCQIRKVQPLKRALNGQSVWITGLRAEHSPNRSNLQVLEWDETNQIIKFNPLLHWTTEEVKECINKYNIPYNSLHDRGFISIGCAPCTRAVREGEDFRAGRWWWEDKSKKECGLHVHR
jgi:phosphoadenosine phosphosulfate reductase